MKTGFSIQSPVLINNTSYNEKARYLGGHKDLESLLTFLKTEGVHSIEIRKLERGASSQAFQESIQLIWDMGLEITVHGDINEDFSGERFVEIYPSLEFILTNFEKYQKKLVMPLHAFQSNSGDVNKFKLETIELLGKWSSFIDQEKLPVSIALENNRNKEAIDPGNSTEGVIEMVSAINSPHVGICWDMGHYYSNLIKKADLESRPEDYLEGLPSSLFLEKVYHTHIHGLNTQKTTHFPLTEQQSLPLERYITALKNVDYDGVYNLELSLPRWGVDIIHNQEISNTIKRLQIAISG